MTAGHSRQIRFRWFIAGLCLLLAACPRLQARTHEAAGAPMALSEYAVKAALLFNIAKYADWPPNAFASENDPIVLGILGPDPFGEVLDRVVKGRLIKGHPVIVRRAQGVAELRGAHLVFISSAEPQSVQACAALEGFNIITVGETRQTAACAAFNFAVEREKVVFTVDLDRTARAGVNMSSHLLNLASAVKRTAEPVLP